MFFGLQDLKLGPTVTTHALICLFLYFHYYFYKRGSISLLLLAGSRLGFWDNKARLTTEMAIFIGEQVFVIRQILQLDIVETFNLTHFYFTLYLSIFYWNSFQYFYNYLWLCKSSLFHLYLIWNTNRCFFLKSHQMKERLWVRTIMCLTFQMQADDGKSFLLVELHRFFYYIYMMNQSQSLSWLGNTTIRYWKCHKKHTSINTIQTL